MSNRDEDILAELQNISFVLGDLNAIRNGEYDPPRGADPSSRRVRATPDDIYNTLKTIVGLLERQNTMIYNIGLNADQGDEYWAKQNRDA